MTDFRSTNPLSTELQHGWLRCEGPPGSPWSLCREGTASPCPQAGPLKVGDHVQAAPSINPWVGGCSYPSAALNYRRFLVTYFLQPLEVPLDSSISLQSTSHSLPVLCHQQTCWGYILPIIQIINESVQETLYRPLGYTACYRLPTSLDIHSCRSHDWKRFSRLVVPSPSQKSKWGWTAGISLNLATCLTYCSLKIQSPFTFLSVILHVFADSKMKLWTALLVLTYIIQSHRRIQYSLLHYHA